MITVDDYFMGRRETCPDEYESHFAINAVVTVDRANLLLSKFRVATGDTDSRKVRSGWRPPSINAKTPGAATKSGHMDGRSLDIEDVVNDFDAWLMTTAGEDALRHCNLWHEHPEATPTWAHVQTYPPGSGNLHFKVK